MNTAFKIASKFKYVLIGFCILISIGSSGQFYLSYDHTQEVDSLWFTLDGKYLVSFSLIGFGHKDINSPDDPGYYIVENVQRKTRTSMSRKEFRESFFKEGNYLTYSESGNPRKDNLELKRPKLSKPKLPGGSHQIIVAPNGKHMLIESMGGGLKLWDIQNNVILKSLDEIEYENTYHLLFSEDSKRLAALTKNKIYLWDIDQSKVIWEVKVIDEQSYSIAMAWSHDGTHFAFETHNKILVWDILKDEPVKQFILNDSLRISKIVFSPDGNYLATASEHGHDERIKNKPWKIYEEGSKVRGLVHLWALNDNTINSVSTTEEKKYNNPKVLWETVDENIPINNNKNTNRYALIFGNEDYQRL